MARHTHYFLLPYIIVEENFTINIAFKLNISFANFVLHELLAFIIIVYTFFNLVSIFCFSVSELILFLSITPMAESFAAVCDTLLKFHNLSAKFVYNFDE